MILRPATPEICFRNLLVGESFSSGQRIRLALVSGRGENDHRHRGDVPEIDHADGAVTLASVKRILSTDRAEL